MHPTVYRCLFTRPQLLGSPALSPLPTASSTPQGNGDADRNGVDDSRDIAVDYDCRKNVPVSMVVRAVRTLSSPPFLRRGVASVGRRGKERENGGCPPRLQLAAVSVLKALVSGDGAKYVVMATAAAEAGVPVKDGEEEGKQGEDEQDTGELWFFVSCRVHADRVSGEVSVLQSIYEKGQSRKSCHASLFEEYTIIL